MTRTVISRMFIAIAVALLAVAPARSMARTTKSATTAPARRVDASARHPAIQAGIAELAKEIEAALRAGEDAPRGQSDYFSGQTDIPPAAVMTALRRPIGSDVRVQSYVKWQLLSALPNPLDENTADDLLQVYRSAPALFPRPGIDKSQRDELDRLIRGAKESEAELLAERFEQMVERVARDNTHLLAYRDGLFANLPPGYDALAAGLEDAAARSAVGAAAAEHTRSVCEAITPWAAANPPPEQLRAMSRALTQLERKRGQPYYNKVYWSAGYGRMTFSKSRGSLASVSQLEEAREFLDDKIRNPTAPLKLKEER